MKTKRRRFWIGFGSLAAVALGIAAYALQTRGAAHDLGLTNSDLAAGSYPDVEALRAKTKAVADAYLAQRETELKELCGGPFQLAFDDSLSPKASALGYRSSFYYYCWDIYLPYSLQPNSGSPYTLLVQLSDGTEGHQHDPGKSRVLRAIVIDPTGLTRRTLQ
ncbi:hypothetical protein CfE428DRAFT_3948 [Chthoniobacter flavus Ellin428]|uniref:Uncharacterized protein n=1 Tax=Chthoniobacter flavus Ellin428 TaxID=497964 RepID=B4D4W0_9BACT|nr:hypothetical protein [Chthoniobacter flavus]EDY18563.1 hypothetical protein CfE428DRAFT_3948 [Chthoniobacter flavus Ellin428]TCO90982.1 hypothetical protein EV701_109132 [Chthoniobacter flavus]